MKEQIKAPEKIKLSDEQIANLSDAQFKTLVIRMLTELVEFGHKLDEKNEGYAKRNKGNAQGTNSDGKETRTQLNGMDQMEEINIQPAQTLKQEFKQMSSSLGTSGTTLNGPTSES